MAKSTKGLDAKGKFEAAQAQRKAAKESGKKKVKEKKIGTKYSGVSKNSNAKGKKKA